MMEQGQMGQDKMKGESRVLRLKGKVQQYAWGGHSFLPELLSVPNQDGRPFAEYWLGAHDNAPSELVFPSPDEDNAGPRMPVKLNEYLAQWTGDLLGAATAQRFGRLPYLLKILDVRDMLSIQVHPSKKDAEIEFAAENHRGIPLSAPDRNYKDDNHKPELMVALSDFWLLHGFKPPEEMERILQRIPELRFLAPVFAEQGYHGLYKTVMEMEPGRVNETLQPLLDRILPAYERHQLPKKEEDFWAARAALTFNETGRIDRGIFSIYLFNLLNLLPGEAIFQDAGLPHAYLEGQNVEIMANSDNVLRGGLTPKHIDVPELLKHIKFEKTEPRIIRGQNDHDEGHISVFKTPAPDFELSRIGLLEDETITISSRSVEIFMVLEGELLVEESRQNAFTRTKGEAFLAFDRARVSLKAGKDSVVYRAAVPL
jgi:mannose-6-phosphate isomerase